MSSPTPQCKPSLAPHPCCAPLSALFPSSEISEITSIKKEDVISTLQYLNLINYYKVPGLFRSLFKPFGGCEGVGVRRWWW